MIWHLAQPVGKGVGGVRLVNVNHIFSTYLDWFILKLIFFSPFYFLFKLYRSMGVEGQNKTKKRLEDSAELMNDVWLPFSSNVKSRWWKAEPYLHRSCSTYKEISTHSQDQQWHRPRRERTLFCSPICRVPSLSVRKPSGGGRRVGAGRLPCFSGWWRVRAPVFKHVCLGLPDVVFVTGYQTGWR